MAGWAAIGATVGLRIIAFGSAYRGSAAVEFAEVLAIIGGRQITAAVGMHFVVTIGLGIFVYAV